ncbi:MAG: PEGA domain-containing protein [Spirochaetaceae bacterium]|jgi:hypothetical protein|nr:PEGA domain-containing protein [Spirochaetaceae bacterium]
MVKSFFVKAVGVLMVLVLFGSCAGTTTMRVNATDPNGRLIDNATVLVNGENIGQTPNASVEVSNFVGTEAEITVSKEGYYPTRTEAVHKVKPKNIILGSLLNVFAFLWVVGPKAQQNVVLTPVATAGQ